MRVTGGTGRGRRLHVPAGQRVRPTSDKVKQALFNILGEKVRGAAFLDLFAGAGGVGIEALSRGAERVVFVESSRGPLSVIRQNIDLAGFGARTEVVASRTDVYLRKTTEQFDILYLDPPYAEELQPLLELISSVGLMRQEGIVIAEHFKKQPSPQAAGNLVLNREARYGDTILAFYQVRGAEKQDQEGRSGTWQYADKELS